jgi:hypothetical protein
MKTIQRLFHLLLFFILLYAAAPLSYASETKYATDSPIGADEWVYIAGSGIGADEWWIITDNITIADIVITSKASTNVKWIYFSDSPIGADKWVMITNDGIAANKWVYIEDEHLKKRLLGGE